MKLKELYDRIDALAPFALSKEYCERFGHYDNSGIILDCGEEITGVLFALDLTKEAIARAKRVGANCIVTHHPAIFAPIKSLSYESPVFLCARAGISIISAHLNLDVAPNGIDDSLMRLLGGDAPLAVMDTLSGGTYGKVFEVKECTLSAFCERAVGKSADRVTVYGDRSVKRVASFCGAGLDEKSLAFAAMNGADTVVSSDAKHHLILAAAERGLNLVLLTHYTSESYGFHAFYEQIKTKLSVSCEYFADDRLK